MDSGINPIGMTHKAIMENSINKHYKYYLIVLFFYIAAIFYLSSQSDSSLSIGDSKTERMIWNLGHIPLYGLLGIILYIVIKNNVSFPFISSTHVIFVIILGMAIAVTDEILQSFSPGRTASISDLMHDLIGILAAIWFMNSRFAARR